MAVHDVSCCMLCIDPLIYYLLVLVSTHCLIACLVSVDRLWHLNAVIVGADVGAEREDHEYKSVMNCVDGVSQSLSGVSGVF